MKRLDLVGIAFALTSIVFCVFGLSHFQSNTEDVMQWLPDQSLAREQYDLFSESFGSDDFLIVTWDGCTVDDDRQGVFSQYVRDNDPQHLIQTVTNGAEIAKRLAHDMKMSWESIAWRLRGIFFGVDNPELTCVIVELSPVGTANRIASMQLVWDAIDAVPDLDRNDVSLGGYPYIATIIDSQLKNSYRDFLLPSIVLATIVALMCLRNLALTLIVFVAAVGASAASIAFIPFCGMKCGGMLSIIPALVFVLTTSGSIHLIRYGLDSIGDPRKLLAIGWKPCTISTVTTAIGMLSLTRSDFPAIRNFGFFCASGVGFALAFQLVMVPWMLSRFGQSGLRKMAARSDTSTFWQNLVGQIRNQRVLISAFSIFIMLMGGLGLTKLIAEVEAEKLFRPDSEIRISLANLEKQLGPMDQTELLVVFEHADTDHFPDRANLVRKIQAGLLQLPQVAVAHSLASLLPSEPTKSNAMSFAKRSTYRSLLRRERENLANGNLLDIEADSETWRISVRFPFSESRDFGKLAKDIVDVSTLIVDSSEVLDPWETTPSTTRLIYTGKLHLFQHAQRTLLTDLFKNFLLAFVIITPIMMIVLRSVPLGLIAMLPNLFPTLVVFGALGWFGHPIDLAIAMTACVALGIAVDDTTHFLIRFGEFGGRLDNIALPIKQTIAQCGPAMCHTTLIGSAGLIVYYFSEMLVLSRFTGAVTVLLIVALLADLIMLPAILLLFCPSKGDERQEDHPTQEESSIRRILPEKALTPVHFRWNPLSRG